VKSIALFVLLILLLASVVAQLGSPAFAGAPGTVSFKISTITSTLVYPASLAAGDLSGNGIPDLAVVGVNGPLSYAMGKGDGTFGSWQFGDSGSQSLYVTLADVKGNGKLDSIVVDGNNYGLLFIGFGNGHGGFNGEKIIQAYDYPVRVAVADLNGDGVPDLVGIDGGSILDNVFVKLGKMPQGFGPFHYFSVGGCNPSSIVVGDLNHDNIPDLVVADTGCKNNIGHLAVLLGKGDGTFQKPVTYEAGEGPLSLVLADFNGDGNLDVAVATVQGVEVLLGNGDGTFSRPKLYAKGPGPISVVAADFNGDGFIDLAATENNNVIVLLGNGDGTFQPPVRFHCKDCGQLITADFNVDGKPDLASVNSYYGTVTILLNTTPFPTPRPVAFALKRGFGGWPGAGLN
jgi:hypothetical protein